MKLSSLVNQLEQIRLRANNGEFQEFSEGYAGKVVLQLLLDYIGNPKIEEKVNEIPF